MIKYPTWDSSICFPSGKPYFFLKILNYKIQDVAFL